MFSCWRVGSAAGAVPFASLILRTTFARDTFPSALHDLRVERDILRDVEVLRVMRCVGVFVVVDAFVVFGSCCAARRAVRFVGSIRWTAGVATVLVLRRGASNVTGCSRFRWCGQALACSRLFTVARAWSMSAWLMLRRSSG